MAAAWRRRRRLGESDCEQIRTGLIAQPVNTLSSLAYVAGGGWVAARGVQAGRPAAVAFGASSARSAPAASCTTGRARPARSRPTTPASPPLSGSSCCTTRPPSRVASRTVPGVVQLGAAVGAAVPVLPTGRFTNQVVAVLGLAAIATEALSVRDHRPAPPAAAAAVSLALGVIVNGLSRTGGPLCRPDSLLQGHAAWHVLSAVSLTSWARGALLQQAR